MMGVPQIVQDSHQVHTQLHCISTTTTLGWNVGEIFCAHHLLIEILVELLTILCPVLVACTDVIEAAPCFITCMTESWVYDIIISAPCFIICMTETWVYDIIMTKNIVSMSYLGFGVIHSEASNVSGVSVLFKLANHCSKYAALSYWLWSANSVCVTSGAGYFAVSHETLAVHHM